MTVKIDIFTKNLELTDRLNDYVITKVEKLEKFFARAKRNGKTLLIYDAVGKQVRWLMYSLERAGVKNYWFMKGGAKGYYDMLAKQQWSSS